MAALLLPSRVVIPLVGPVAISALVQYALLFVHFYQVAEPPGLLQPVL